MKVAISNEQSLSKNHIISLLLFFFASLLLFILLCILCPAEYVWADPEDKKIIISMPPEGYPPFMIHEDNGSTGGIMLDVLKEISSPKGYTVTVVFYPEKREAKMLELGQIDARAKAKEWIKNSEKYTWSDPIVDSTDILTYLKDKPLVFHKTEDLFGKNLITHLGYTYPVLDPFFSDKRIHRTDVYTELAMLETLMKKQNDAAVINKHVALWLIKKNQEFQGKLELTEKIIDSVGYRIMFTDKNNWKSFVQEFNQELTQMKKDGRLEAIQSKYK